MVVEFRCYLFFPKRLWAALFFASALFGHAAGPQSTRADFLFELRSAVKEHNKDRILACFNLDGADEGTRRTIENAVNQICRWPTDHVFSTERTGDGPLRTKRDGKVWELNGEWEFQVHIFLKETQPGKGYVFPAGKTRGSGKRYAVLLLVEQTP